MSAKNLGGATEFAQAGRVHPQKDPILEGAGAKAAIEGEGAFIPIERGPFKAGAIALDADPRDGINEPAANAFLPKGWADINVVEPETASTDEAGKGEEINGVAGGFVVVGREERASGGLRAEEGFVEGIGGGDEVVFEALEASEFANQFEQDRDLRGRQRLNRPHGANFREGRASIQPYNQPRAAIANCGATS
jgi:hypothetical protein